MSKCAVIVVDNGVQDQEFFYPYYRLQEAGLQVSVAVPSLEQPVKGKYGIPIPATHSFAYLQHLITLPELAAVVVPGGWECPERLRREQRVLGFLRAAAARDIAIGAICHGPWVLISANLVKDRDMTCYEGMADDLRNAGARYSAADVVVDGQFVTAPHYRNNPAFMHELLKLIESKME